MSARWSPSTGLDADPDLPEGAVECPVKDGAFRCEIPAGGLDLRMKARGHVAQYRWNATLPRGGRLDVGTLQLRTGAAVTGRVQATEKGAKVAPVVTLVPQAQEMASAATAKTKQLSLPAVVNERGFFHADGVPPGTYTVIAEQKGFVAARASVKVIENVESELIQPIVLERPHHTDVAVSPPFDADNHPWRVTLLDIGPFAPREGRTFHASYVSPGLYRFSGLSSGEYQISVENGAGEAFHAQAVEIDGSPNVIPISLSIVPVTGRLLLGDKPLSASLWFGGRHRAVSLQMNSDEDGRFRGVLPHAGPWRVEIASENPRVERALEAVDVRKRDGGTAALEIVLPATALHITCVDAGGAPVERAVVEAKIADSSVQFFADASGSVDAQGLPPGPVLLRGSARGTLNSEDTNVSLTAGQTQSVELVLRDSIVVKGIVTGPSGGVAGATVLLWPASQLTPTVRPDTTRADGGFSVRVPPSTTAVNIVVLSPGFALHTERAEVSAAREVRVALTQQGGTLSVEHPSERQPVLARNGVPLFYPLLVQWARLHGQKSSASSLVLQDMEPGMYDICAAPARNCSGGVLAALGSLTLKAAE
jgi:hypothetical protein